MATTAAEIAEALGDLAKAVLERRGELGTTDLTAVPAAEKRSEDAAGDRRPESDPETKQ